MKTGKILMSGAAVVAAAQVVAMLGAERSAAAGITRRASFFLGEVFRPQITKAGTDEDSSKRTFYKKMAEVRSRTSVWTA